jgi:predicted CopG family antitoxin
MGTKVISISERVYTKLDAERWEEESFDDVITRLTEKKSLMNLVGFLKKEDAEEMRTVIKEMREKSRDRTLRIIEETK